MDGELFVDELTSLRITSGVQELKPLGRHLLAVCNHEVRKAATTRGKKRFSVRSWLTLFSATLCMQLKLYRLVQNNAESKGGGGECVSGQTKTSSLAQSSRSLERASESSGATRSRPRRLPQERIVLQYLATYSASTFITSVDCL